MDEAGPWQANCNQYAGVARVEGKSANVQKEVHVVHKVSQSGRGGPDWTKMP